MKHFKRNIVILFFILAVAFQYYLFVSDIPKNDTHLKQIDLLQHQNDSLRHRNRKLAFELVRLDKEQDSLKELIRATSNLTKSLKIRRNEKIIAIRHFDNDQLYRFFAEIEFEADSTTN